MAGKVTTKAESPRPIAEAKGESQEKPKVLRSIEIKQGENGGHIITHNYDNSGPGHGYHEPASHVFGKGDGAKALKHIAKVANIRMGKKTAPVPDEGGNDKNPENKAEAEN